VNRLWTTCTRVALALIVFAASSLTAAAQKQAQDVFVNADTLPRQEIPPGPLLYSAYAFVWFALVVYLFLLWRRIGRVERELADVNQKLAGRK
jgi:CcmD family protein